MLVHPTQHAGPLGVPIGGRLRRDPSAQQLDELVDVPGAVAHRDVVIDQ